MDIKKLALKKLFLYTLFWILLLVVADAAKSHSAILLFFVFFLTWIATETVRMQLKIKTVLLLIGNIQKKKYRLDLNRYYNTVRFAVIFALLSYVMSYFWQGLRVMIYHTEGYSLSEGIFIILIAFMIAQYNETHLYFKKCYEEGKQIFLKTKKEEEG